MSSYESFKPISASDRSNLEYNESASLEAETWLKCFHSVPFGVLKRRMIEEAESEELAKRIELKQLSSSSLQHDHMQEMKKHWMPDAVCKVCYFCESPFSIFRRRHHCRVCGLVFCGACSSHFVNGSQFGFSSQQFVRVCDECYEQSLLSSSVGTSSEFVDNSVHSNTAVEEDPAVLVFVDEEENEVNFEIESACSVEHNEGSSTFVHPLPPPPLLNSLISPFPKLSDQLVSQLAAREERLTQLLMAQSNLPSGSEWPVILTRLCQQVCDTIQPGTGDGLNILDFVSILVLPGTSAENSFKVNGAVLRKNLLHCSMPTHVNRPRILLLESGLELNRGTSANKFVSFERLIEQERLYLELVVRKICALQIDVLLCGGTISPVALELLLEQRISVATLVPLADLMWVSRCTNAVIIPSTERITKLQDPTGTCGIWRMQNIAMRNEENHVVWGTYMFFDQAIKERGCTLLLRGNPSHLNDIAYKLKVLLIRLWTIRNDHAFIAMMDGKFGNSLFGGYVTMEDADDEDLSALVANGIQVTKVKQQQQQLVTNSGQQHNSASLSQFQIFQFYHSKKDSTLHVFLKSAFSKQVNYSVLYLHGFGCVEFSPVERLAKLDLDSIRWFRKTVAQGILTWGNCNKCGQQTNVCLLSPKNLHMSFGRFLQNVFYFEGLQSNKCKHSLLHDYTRFFCQEDSLLSMAVKRNIPLKFEFPRIDLQDDTWFKDFSSELFEHLKDVCLQVVYHFSKTVCAVPAKRYVEELIEQLESKPQLPLPNQMNAKFRDLFLICMEWNLLINTTKLQLPIASSLTRNVPPLLLSPRSSTVVSNHRSLFSSAQMNNQRPSLKEIQDSRQRILLDRKRSSESSKTPPPVFDSHHRANTPPLTDSPRTPPFASHRSSSSSSPRVRLSPRKPSHLQYNKSLPERLVLGHLLLPPGQRLGNTVVPVLESEPTSWIAHALGSNLYSEKLNLLLAANNSNTLLFQQGSSSLQHHPGETASISQVDEELLHVRCGFSDASEYSPRQCAFSVYSYYAAQFHMLRKRFLSKTAGGEENDVAIEQRFIDSLSRCSHWKPSGGKSSATFLKTLDDRFIVKSMSPKELETFQEIAPKYFEHMFSTDSLLVPFLGIFHLTMQSEAVIGRRSIDNDLGNVFSCKMLVVVSPNLFFKQSPQLCYDLKGNAPNRSRYVKNPPKGSVRLDWNFCLDNQGVPLSLEAADQRAFARAVNLDSLFLASLGVVDYSLLVGVEQDSRVVAGIIDYLQLYTIQKMLESHVKQLQQVDPTVVSPNRYQARFAQGMNKYFVSCGTYMFAPPQGTQKEEEEDTSYLTFEGAESFVL